jgi:pimeloyl-ACP methyl ester carboxylesterase
MTEARQVVVLVHGLWMHGMVMQLQQYYLQNMGFEVVCHSYHSMRLTLTENADELARFARTLGTARLHWVGHSLGGLVILRTLERETGLAPGRVVLLGVPYNDSYAARVLSDSNWGSHLVGNSLEEWRKLRKPKTFPGHEIGVIAGSRSMGLGCLVAPGLPEPNDGTVAVAETELAAACDRIVLPVTHTSMLLSRAVADQTGAFLKNGRFDHGAGNS